MRFVVVVGCAVFWLCAECVFAQGTSGGASSLIAEESEGRVPLVRSASEGLGSSTTLGVLREAEGAERDTTEAPQIVLKRRFLGSDKFVYGEQEPESVFTFWGTLSPEIKQVLGQHPGAREEVERASTYATVGVIGSTVLSTLGIITLLNTSTDADTFAEIEESSSNVEQALTYALSAVVVSAVATALARSRVKAGVRMFNERQAESGLTRESGPVVLRQSSATEDPQETVEEQRGPESPRPAGLESWYTYWGLGWANPGYPEELDPTIEDLRGAPGVSDLALSLDLLGFYFPLSGDKTVVGGIINAAGERFEANGESFQINQYLYSASVMHFFNQYIGRGFFARGDVGLARVAVDSSFAGEAGESGFGFLLGGGYGFALTPGTRLLLNVNYGRRSVEGESYSAFSLSLGGLF